MVQTILFHNATHGSNFFSSRRYLFVRLRYLLLRQMVGHLYPAHLHLGGVATFLCFLSMEG
jgi:hypothetical protein